MLLCEVFRIHSLKFTMTGQKVVFTRPPSCTAQSSLFYCSCTRGVPEHPGNCISCTLYVRDFILEGVSQWNPCPNGPQSPLRRRSALVAEKTRPKCAKCQSAYGTRPPLYFYFLTIIWSFRKYDSVAHSMHFSCKGKTETLRDENLFLELKKVQTNGPRRRKRPSSSSALANKAESWPEPGCQVVNFLKTTEKVLQSCSPSSKHTARQGRM